MKIKRVQWLAAMAALAIAIFAWHCGTESHANDKPIAPLLDGMGDVHLEITTNDKIAQRYFNQGLALAYGFNHKEAERAFREVARRDPKAAMGWWGVAYVLGPNLNAAMDDAEVPNAFEAIEKAKKLASGVSKLEQDFINALATRYVAKPVNDRKPYDEAYADAMKKLAAKYPDESHATALSAEALMDLHPWDFWNIDGSPKAWTPEITNTLEAALAKWPNHPGLNHFYIHAVEASKNPGRATPAADRLGDLVPGAGHLVHMPGHIYIRTGRYNDAVLANEKAIKADGDYITQCHAQGLYPVAYMPHNHHFLSASATMAGISKKALSAARYMAEHQDHDMMREPGYGTLQQFSSIPLYTMTKFGFWDELLREPAPAKDLLYPTGVWHFARGMAFTRTNRVREAKQEFVRVKEIAADTSLYHVTIWDLNTTYALMQIAREILAGEIAARENNYPRAIRHLREAVALEDKLAYDEPPAWYAPARHNLGALLLEAGRPAEAEKVFLNDLEKYPNNGWSLKGLTLSYRAQNKTKAAKATEGRFKTAWGNADVVLKSSRF